MAHPKHLASTSMAPSRPAGKSYLVFCALVSLFCALYIECFLSIVTQARTEEMTGLLYGTITVGSLARVASTTIILALPLALLGRHPHIYQWIERHRYVLAAILLVLLIFFEISGSSIGMWAERLNEPQNSGVLFGLPRPIRSDEWCAFTPFSFSQVATGNQAISPVIRGGMTDVTMVYAQPAWSIATIYRPFLWGYLILGASRGLSFYWCARALSLLLITYELMLLIAHGHKKLAGYGAILVAFAPLVEWWFAVNGTVELFVFGEGLVLSLHHLLRTRTVRGRWGWSLLLAWLLGCYAMIIYPAWQIPLVYVFGFLGLWDIWEYHKHEEHEDAAKPVSVIIPLLVTCCLSIGGIACSVWQAWDAIQLTLHTVYPGDRFFTGGGYFSILHNPITAVVSGFWTDLYTGNVCESSAFISLSPFGALLSALLVLRGAVRRRIDSGLVFVLVPYAFLMAYGILGFPATLAKLSLLSYTPTGRLPIAMGYLDVVLLVRSLSCLQDNQLQHEGNADRSHRTWHTVASGLIAFGFVSLLVWWARTGTPLLMGTKASVIVAGAYMLLALPVFLPTRFFVASSEGRGSWMMASALVVLVIALCVNPIQKGADALLKSETLESASAISKQDPAALWIVDSTILGQGCITAGIPTVNSLNVYPNLDLWHKIDPTGAYEDTYNRYAHIGACLADKTSFELLAADSLMVFLTPEDAVKLGVSYWLSDEDLARWNSESVTFVPVKPAGAFTVYRIIGDAT